VKMDTLMRMLTSYDIAQTRKREQRILIALRLRQKPDCFCGVVKLTFEFWLVCVMV
jgi:hypothetical protein